MHKIVFIYTLIFLFVVNSKSFAQKVEVITDTSYVQPPEASKEEVYEEEVKEQQIEYVDTVLYKNNLKIDKDSVATLKQNKSFAYVQYLDSLLKEKDKEKPVKRDNSNDGSGLSSFFSSTFLKIILWGLAIAFVLFILVKLFFTDGIFKKKTTSKDDVAEQIIEEEITAETNFDKYILQAEQSGNYRLAIRYHYLKLLHQLAQQNYLQLATDKTNYQYVQELQQQEMRKKFAKITLNYEYVWYGEFNIDNSLYQQLTPSFKNFMI